MSQLLYRNPFALRASEKIAEDTTFLKLFSVESLQPLIGLYGNDMLWGNVVRIISAPGGGKTSLLRVFTPSVLINVARNHNSAAYKSIFNALKKIDAVEEGYRYKRCGAYFLIDRDFSYVLDLENLPGIKKKRIFYALINARICLTVIKSIMQLKKLNRKDLAKVVYTPPIDDFAVEELGLKGNSITLDKLYQWAAGVENSVCDYLDAIRSDDPVVHKSIFAFNLFKSQYFKYKGEPVCDEFIFMLDDTHKLGRDLFQVLEEQIVETRNTATIFLAERKEVLPHEDLINRNNAIGRDFQDIDLDSEKYEKWKKKVFFEVSTSRSELSQYRIDLLNSLENDINSDYDNDFYRIIEEQKAIIRAKDPVLCFDNLMSYVEDMDETPEVKASYFKAMAILAARGMTRLFPYEVEDIPTILKGDFLSLAKKLMIAEYKVPMYYGGDDIMDLATGNVEQFIGFASEMYGRLIGKHISGESVTLDAKEQSDLIEQYSSRLFDQIKYLPDGSMITNFMNNLLKYCHDITFDEKSSYRVVSGFAVSTSRTPADWFEKEKYHDLANVIRTCLANNLLFVRDITQGAPGEVWKVFYLNRFICAHKRIPLNYGGWRKIRIEELNDWLGNG